MLGRSVLAKPVSFIFIDYDTSKKDTFFIVIQLVIVITLIKLRNSGLIV